MFRITKGLAFFPSLHSDSIAEPHTQFSLEGSPAALHQTRKTRFDSILDSRLLNLKLKSRWKEVLQTDARPVKHDSILDSRFSIAEPLTQISLEGSPADRRQTRKTRFDPRFSIL